eukprot:Colp12_sorted_trinity150504_noHs@21668
MTEWLASLRQARQRWFATSYVFDWICLIVFVAVSLGTSSSVTPHERFFNASLVEYGYGGVYDGPLTPDTVPNWALVPIGLAPVVIIFLYPFLLRGFIFKNFANWDLLWHDLHCGILAYAEGQAINLVFTDTVKVAAGRYRPDWLSRFAKQTMLRDGHLSFPSGHSSISFCVAVFIALYLSGKLGIFRGKTRGSFWRVFIAILIPFGFAWFVAVSRTRDYRHNFSDVLAGACIGLVSGALGYFLHYRNPGSKEGMWPCNRMEHSRESLMEEARSVDQLTKSGHVSDI